MVDEVNTYNMHMEYSIVTREDFGAVIKNKSGDCMWLQM